MKSSEIKDAILDGDITAITIDTSVFDAAKLGLEFGALKRLAQFKDGSTDFVLSDIVAKELRGHMIKEATETQAAFRKATSALGSAWGHSIQERDLLVNTAFKKQTPEENADDRMQSYFESTGAKYALAGERVNVEKLVQMYFQLTPPFSETKKHEFPDALALLALEAWATERDTKILAVTKDGDWKAYCKTSERLVAIDDLGTALSLFQEEETRYFCQVIGKQIQGLDPEKLVPRINAALKVYEDRIDVSADGDSQFRCEPSMAEASVGEMDLSTLTELEALDRDHDELVAKFSVTVPVDVTAYFSFEKWDGIDGEYMAMGSGSAAQSTEVEAEIVLTIGGKLPDHPEIIDIEVSFSDVRVEFTDLEPDWMSDPDNFGD
ncbi:MAG: PIN domain-containing protein [Pseudomonadota bacterium]